MKFKSVLLAALGLLAAQSCVLAGSTVDPTQPPAHGAMLSAPVRNNFLAAYTDINNLLSDFAGSAAPANPLIGQRWRKTDVTPNLIYQWSGTAWLQVATFDVTGGAVTPYFGSRLLAWQELMPGLGTNGQCLVFTGTSTNPTAQNCLNATNFTATAPISASASGANETIGIHLDSNFATVGGNLALASAAAGNLIANCGGSSAEPTACSWSAFANQAIGSTNGMFPARFSGAWQAGTFGTGLAFSGTTLNLQPASSGAIGGVNSIASLAHNWVAYIDAAGLPHQSQPAVGDLSGAAALTSSNDTNVTVTLGGTPASALLAATSITMGWNGTLAVGRGGTGLGSGTSGGVPYFQSASTMASSGILTTNQIMIGGGAGGAPAALGSYGSTTTVLHGNSGTGAPVFGAVNLTTDVGGTLQAAQEPAHTGDVTNTAGSLVLAYTNVVPANKGGAGGVTGALKADGSGNVSQAATTDLSDVSSGTCTWSDQSGAALALTGTTNCKWQKRGNWVQLYGTVTLPSTANATAALIGFVGAPTVPNQSYAATANPIKTSGATSAVVAVPVINTTNFNIWSNSSGANVTNGLFSTFTLTVSIGYPAS